MIHSYFTPKANQEEPKRDDDGVVYAELDLQNSAPGILLDICGNAAGVLTMCFECEVETNPSS